MPDVMQTMRALVKIAVGEGNVELRPAPIPPVDPDEVLVRVAHVGICGSDLHILHDTHPYHPPVILGHEFAGTIAQVGERVSGWRVGDRVVAELHGGACQRCHLCRTGNVFACPHKRPIGWWTNGAYADFIAVPAWLLHRVPDDLPLLHAALTEPLAVCMNVLHRAPVIPQRIVTVIGPGPIGILAALAAKASGAGRVILVGRSSSKQRLALATRLGIEHVIDTSVEELESVVGSLTNGMGSDLVIEAGGTEASIRDAVKAARKLGTIAALGVGPEECRLPWNEVVFKALSVVFSFSADYLAFEQALDLLRSRKVPAEELIGGEYRLEDWQDAFKALEERRALKLILNP